MDSLSSEELDLLRKAMADEYASAQPAERMTVYADTPWRDLYNRAVSRVWAWHFALEEVRWFGKWQIEMAVTPLAWSLLPAYHAWDETPNVTWLCLRISWWIR